MSEKKNSALNFREIKCESCSGCYHNRVGECDLHNFKLTNTNNVVCDDFSPNEERIQEIESKKKTELEKIMDLQELIDKAKNLIFAAQDIDCTIDYPYCQEIQREKPYASMSKELSIVRSTLEWMDNMCWSYQRLKK